MNQEGTSIMTADLGEKTKCKRITRTNQEATEKE